LQKPIVWHPSLRISIVDGAPCATQEEEEESHSELPGRTTAEDTGSCTEVEVDWRTDTGEVRLLRDWRGNFLELPRQQMVPTESATFRSHTSHDVDAPQFVTLKRCKFRAATHLFTATFCRRLLLLYIQFNSFLCVVTKGPVM